MSKIQDLLDRKPNEENILSSTIARSGVTGSACGSLIAIALIVLFPIPVTGQVGLLTSLAVLGRTFGRIFAARNLNRTNIVSNDHLTDFQSTLKKVVPPEHLIEATNYILELDPHPVLLQDPVWLSRNLPKQLKESRRSARASRSLASRSKPKSKATTNE